MKKTRASLERLDIEAVGTSDAPWLGHCDQRYFNNIGRLAEKRISNIAARPGLQFADTIGICQIPSDPNSRACDHEEDQSFRQDDEDVLATDQMVAGHIANSNTRMEETAARPWHGTQWKGW